MQFVQNNNVFASKEKKQGTNHHMRNQQAAACGTTGVAAVTWKYGKLAYLHQDGDRKWRLTTDWTLVLLGCLGSYGIGMSP